MSEVYLRRIGENVQTHSVVVTNYYQEYRSSPYRYVPFFDAWQVQREKLAAPKEEISPLDAVFGGRIRLLGHHMEARSIATGETLCVRVYWSPETQLDRDYSFFLHLVSNDGIIGQGDITHPAASYGVGEVLINEYRVPVLPGTAPGAYQIITGVYVTFPDGRWERILMEDGQDLVSMGQIRVMASLDAPVTSHPMLVPFANGVRLIGVEQDASVEGVHRLYLHWRYPSEVECEAVVTGSDGASSSASLASPPGSDHLTTVHDLPEGSGSLNVKLLSTGTGESIPSLGPWRIPRSATVALPPTRAQSRHVSFGREMALTGVDIGPQRLDRTLNVTLSFLALRPIPNDYVVSVSAEAEDGSWKAQHDTVPALGAIPTLKWVSGWRVTDPHVLQIPEGAVGSARLRLTVYDAFTFRPLPVLDDRLARAGQGTQLEIGRLEVR